MLDFFEGGGKRERRAKCERESWKEVRIREREREAQAGLGWSCTE
jgi:hypothetical protein